MPSKPDKLTSERERKARNQRDRRARQNAKGLALVANCWAPPQLHDRIREYAAELTAAPDAVSAASTGSAPAGA